MRPRLLEALNLLGKCECLADIGCDHGRLSVSALQKGAAERVIASDISEASLAKAGALAERCGYAGRIDFRCADGFDGFSAGECDKAVIAGMGGELIVSILEKNIPVVNALETIVMQPMRGEAELRKYIYTNRFTVLNETVVYDSGRYYQLISARRGEPTPLPFDWPENFWQFPPPAFMRRDESLLKLMERYRFVLTQKLKSAEAKGKMPAALLRERDCTEKLITLYAGSFFPLNKREQTGDCINQASKQLTDR